MKNNNYLIKKYRKQIAEILADRGYITCPSCGRSNLEYFRCLYRDCSEYHKDLETISYQIKKAQYLNDTLELLEILKKEKLL
ncbi:hypothetical protein LCGC14_0305950 [marine sediment metagenome]|uniref:Uncharacterized protein n=1 Tax=marine sediment metagenome TaxID=412755 RepID=A0A0F9WAN8_9ZZZZ